MYNDVYITDGSESEDGTTMRKLLRMMLVDDESLILRGLKETYDWRSMGFEIVGTALDGDLALDLLDEVNPDIIMTDISMKRMSGLELMEEVRKRRMDVEFMVLSAYREFEYAQTAIRNGALQYLIKPLDDEELASTMKEVYEKCISKMEERENYDSWKKVLMEDRDNFLQAMTRKYLESGIERAELQRIYQSLRMEEYLDRYFLAVCADLDYACQVIHQEEYNQKRHVLGMLLHNRLKEKYTVQTFARQDGCQVYLLFLREKTDGVQIRKLLWDMEKELKSTVVSSISNCYEGMEGLKRAYQEAAELYRVACEAGVSGLSLKKGEKLDVKGSYSLDVENQVLLAVRRGDEGQLKSACEKFVYMIPDEESGKIYYHRLMTRVEFALAETEQLSEELRKSFESFYSCIYRFQLVRLIDLAYKLLQKVIEQKQNGVSRASEMLFGEYIQQATAYIEEHLADEGLSIAQVAEQLHLNPVYFGRIFKSVYGISLKKYILNLRIERAKALLIEGNSNITAVGSSVGISNPSYFTKVFRESTGKLPSEYLG